MADIFISYKREDRERIAPLARALEALGYTVWWDLELVPSQKFERQIKRELDAAKCVIVVWTDRSIADDGMYVSEWVQIEANSGDQRGILLPVQLDAGRTHWRHGQNQFAALDGWTGDESATGFQHLLKGVELHVGARARPPDPEFSAWQHAERTETAYEFGRFLEAYPQSRFADIARSRIAELEELAAWQALGAAPTIAALASFLRSYPAGRFKDDAKAKIRSQGTMPHRHTNPAEVGGAKGQALTNLSIAMGAGVLCAFLFSTRPWFSPGEIMAGGAAISAALAAMQYTFRHRFKPASIYMDIAVVAVSAVAWFFVFASVIYALDQGGNNSLAVSILGGVAGATVTAVVMVRLNKNVG